jgi:hypothetical protein
MEKKDIFEFIYNNLTFELDSRDKVVFWYLRSEAPGQNSINQTGLFFNTMDRNLSIEERWNLVMEYLTVYLPSLESK